MTNPEVQPTLDAKADNQLRIERQEAIAVKEQVMGQLSDTQNDLLVAKDRVTEIEDCLQRIIDLNELPDDDYIKKYPGGEDDSSLVLARTVLNRTK